jgi:hypothetical protein
MTCVHTAAARSLSACPGHTSTAFPRLAPPGGEGQRAGLLSPDIREEETR